MNKPYCVELISKITFNNGAIRSGLATFVAFSYEQVTHNAQELALQHCGVQQGIIGTKIAILSPTSIATKVGKQYFHSK